VVLWITVPVAKGDEAFAMRMQKEHKSKKLFRDNDSRVVGGVASGLANYFALDVVWLRIAFVVALFVFGTGFWLYIILWIIVPKAISASDKLLMKGRTVDIHSIQQQVLETQNTSRVNSIAQHSTHLIGLVLKGIIKLFGSFLAIILFVMVISISIAMVSIFFNLGNTAQLNELIRFTVQDPSIVIAAKAGVFLCILTPIIAILMLVIRSLFKLSFANRAWFFSLLGLFLTGVVCLIYAGVSFGTSVNHNESKSSITRLAPADSLFISGIDMEEDEAIEIENEGEVVFYDKGLIIGKEVVHFEIDDIKIKGSKNDSAYLKIIKRANGRDKQDAIDKIQIPNFFQIHKSKQFSWQEIDVILVLPIGTVVHLDDISKENLDENNIDEADGHYYKVTSNGLSCIDCVYDENDITIDDSIEIDENEVKDVDIKIEGKDGDKMTIKVEKGGEGKSKKVTTKTKGDKEVRIEETQIGPVKITKETTINK
jgi:phage shock protein PspC (stress-responsive transcriptional regulator)